METVGDDEKDVSKPIGLSTQVFEPCVEIDQHDVVQLHHRFRDLGENVLDDAVAALPFVRPMTRRSNPSPSPPTPRAPA